MDKKTVLIVIVSSVLILLVLGIVFSFVFAGIDPDVSLFGSGSVAYIQLKGTIASEESFLSTTSGAGGIVELIEEAEADPSIKGILLEINSGGGSAVASKRIVRALRKAKKPKLALISDMGASGGYYAAAACDYIIADEDSIMGSLGAIISVLDLSGLKDIHGIGSNTFAGGDHKGMGDPFGELDETEKQILQSIADQSAKGFRDDVLEFRAEKIDQSKLSEMFDGRIMNGSQALEYGLIDELGSKPEAVKKIGELIGVEEPLLKEFSHSTSIFSILNQSGFSFGQGLKSSLQSEEISLR